MRQKSCDIYAELKRHGAEVGDWLVYENEAQTIVGLECEDYLGWQYVIEGEHIGCLYAATQNAHDTLEAPTKLIKIKVQVLDLENVYSRTCKVTHEEIPLKWSADRDTKIEEARAEIKEAKARLEEAE